jgi:hypothetical protein
MRRLWNKARRLIKSTLETVSTALEPVAKPLFAINQFSSLVRTGIFAAAILLWVGYAIIKNPIKAPVLAPPGPTLPAQMLFQLKFMFAMFIEFLRPLFAAEVFRSVLGIAFAFWLAYRLASIYLADIFELPDVAVASKFIRQAAFYTVNPMKYNRLVIRDGKIAPESEDSPISQIGGPGMVYVNLENVAVFEKVDGEPHIIHPSRWPVRLEGFERLRKIIDLRDQFEEGLSVLGRTKDGIPVEAKGIRFSYSIRRDTKLQYEEDDFTLEDTRLPQPLSFTETSVLNNIYRKANRTFQEVASSDILSEIRRFIGRNTLNEFLADSRRESGKAEGQASDPTMPLVMKVPEFKDRGTVNQELINFFKNAAAPTIDIHWVSVGTWEPPELIQEKYKDAWTRTLQSQLDSNDRALRRLFRTTRISELLRLIQDVPINAFGHVASREGDPDAIIRELLLAYREKLKNADDLARRKDAGWTPPETMKISIRYLNHLLK